jgi:predicted TIM-barrel fold metal-dependent hydrolase
MIGKHQVVALEEHYWDPEVAEHFTGREGRAPALRARLDDVGELRIKEMDEAGIDLTVLSHGAPSTQRLNPEAAMGIAQRANDRLHEAVLAHPGRFAAFACLPTPDPQGAADELERAVNKLGFVGAMIHGLTQLPGSGGEWLFPDNKLLWPIFERAEALDVPIYLHPAAPHPMVTQAYYQDYAQRFPGILSASWGYTVETATMGLRMVLSGVFDAYPRLKIILGHMGEGLPFLLWRIDYTLRRAGNERIDFRDLFTEHFWITTSGNFSTPSLICSMLEMGSDRIMYSVDYPFVDNLPGTEWMRDVQISAEDKDKILSGNAKRLLRL